MKPDEFEKQLQRQPVRKMPKEWRADILQIATNTVAADVRRRTDEAPDAAQFNRVLASVATKQSWWREWLWPCPQAWAGLAAAWIVIVSLNATTSLRSSEMAKQTPIPSPEVETTLAVQRRELARLLDNSGESGPKPKTPPGPRSESFSPPKV